MTSNVSATCDGPTWRKKWRDGPLTWPLSRVYAYRGPSDEASGEEFWELHDYLSEQRRMVDTKYDYRYSVLISLFGRLVAERWLSLDDLAGLTDEKIQLIERSAAFRHNHYPSAGHAPGGAPENHPRS